MKLPEAYTQIQTQKGLPLAALNPNSREVALPRQSALEALSTLKGSRVAVLGGDVLTQKDGLLKYVYANWFCAKQNGESLDEYAERSLRYASSYVSSFTPANDFEPLFVFVLEDING